MKKIAIVGSTGLVGTEMLKVLENSKINVSELYPVASNKSIGKSIYFKNKEYRIISLEKAVSLKPDIAIFSAGSEVSKMWAPKFENVGSFVIDNSSMWRMFDHVPLVVPEINTHCINENTKIIANPNCSTIQMVVALAPLHKKYRIKRLVISTYQSVTGTGAMAVQQLMNERNKNYDFKVYPHQIDLNCFPHGGNFTENGYTSEEIKLTNETRKILEDNSIGITSTVVRIPVIGGHSECVNVEFYNEFELQDVKHILTQSKGIILQDEPTKNIYPMPLTAHGKDEVFVGRIRRDDSQDKTLNMWIVADNLRKGAATNAIQIAEYLIEKKFC